MGSLRGLDSTQVKNAFFANYLSALILVKKGDKNGIRLITDRHKVDIPPFTAGMSSLMFWARALFHPDDARVKRELQTGHAELLQTETGRILPSRIASLLRTLSIPTERVNWRDIVSALVILKHRFSLNSSYFNKLVVALARWETLSEISKQAACQNAFLYLTQSDKSSNLLSRMREQTGNSLLSNVRGFMKLAAIKIINEDDSAGFDTGAGNVASVDNAIICRDNDVIQSWLPYTYGKAPKKKTEKSKFKVKQRKFKMIKFKDPSRKTPNDN